MPRSLPEPVGRVVERPRGDLLVDDVVRLPPLPELDAVGVEFVEHRLHARVDRARADRVAHPRHLIPGVGGPVRDPDTGLLRGEQPPQEFRSFPVRPEKSVYHSTVGAFQETRSPRPSTANTGNFRCSSTRLRTSPTVRSSASVGRAAAATFSEPSACRYRRSVSSKRSASARLSRMTGDGRTLLPCSKRLYQAGLTLARKATSSRRSPGERRRWLTGNPTLPGLMRSRRVLR